MAELKRRKLILDVDTGSDDAMAMIAAMMSPEFEVIGVCSVNGNREVKLTTLNTLRVMELLDSNVPVYRGCEYPMVSTLDRKPMLPYREGDLDGTDIGVIHGDHLPLPGPTWRKEEDLNAVSYYVKTLRETKEKITLVESLQDRLSSAFCPTNNHVWKDGVCVKCGKPYGTDQTL